MFSLLYFLFCLLVTWYGFVRLLAKFPFTLAKIRNGFSAAQAYAPAVGSQSESYKGGTKGGILVQCIFTENRRWGSGVDAALLDFNRSEIEIVGSSTGLQQPCRVDHNDFTTWTDQGMLCFPPTLLARLVREQRKQFVERRGYCVWECTNCF